MVAQLSKSRRLSLCGWAAAAQAEAGLPPPRPPSRGRTPGPGSRPSGRWATTRPNSGRPIEVCNDRPL
ncbi:unnamed protein product [Sphagnum troendelagicum]|uniref:Uncharacterized protein n=1 Tax=Sphagnum troendelagicum TaxID=128251 RepID=A0ABP0UYA4_9BRYO